MIDPTARTAAYHLIRNLPANRIGFAALHAMGLSGALSKPRNCDIQHLHIPRSKGGKPLKLTLLRPRTAPPDLPVLLHLHGGGYLVGAPYQDYPLFAQLLAARPCLIVAPHYRRACQVPFPAALDDSHDALIWARDHAAQFGGRGETIAVMGESAGGGLAAALCLSARERQSVGITAQFLPYAMLDNRDDHWTCLPERELTWSAAQNRHGWQAYARGSSSPFAAPALAQDLSNLPPAFGFVGTHDLFHDENRAYFERLSQAGVKTDFTVLQGAYHGVELFAPKSTTGRTARDLLLRAYEAWHDRVSTG